MDKKRVGVNTPGSNRAGEYEMLDRNMAGSNYNSGIQQPYGAHPNGGNVSRSDLDVLETTGPVHNNSYQHDMYGGGGVVGGGDHYAGDASSGYYGGEAGGHYVDNASGQYQNDAGVGYFQHGDEYGANTYDNGYQQAYKPLPTPNMLAGAPINQSFGGLHEA
ncbi:hypothetical protein LPJ73_004535, partial [Coemansia sp. RSA 2703]